MSLIKLKKSSEPGKLPQPEDLEFGELALNYADGQLYYKKSNGTVDTIGGGGLLGTRTVTESVATDNQTVFNIPGGYTLGFVDVTINGSQLLSTDYTATNGTSISLIEPAVVGDSVKIISYNPVSLADTYRKFEVDEIANNRAIVMAIALG
jgi:hypothetical protein